MYLISDCVCSWLLCEYICDIVIYENYMIFNLSLYCFVNSLFVIDKLVNLKKLLNVFFLIMFVCI